jgi:hypothetical protein
MPESTLSPQSGTKYLATGCDTEIVPDIFLQVPMRSWTPWRKVTSDRERKPDRNSVASVQSFKLAKVFIENCKILYLFCCSTKLQKIVLVKPSEHIQNLLVFIDRQRKICLVTWSL